MFKRKPKVTAQTIDEKLNSGKWDGLRMANTAIASTRTWKTWKRSKDAELGIEAGRMPMPEMIDGMFVQVDESLSFGDVRFAY